MSEEKDGLKFGWLGATSQGLEDRDENDFYATDPIAATFLLAEEEFEDNIWECANGKGHLSSVFEKSGYTVRKSDLINRGQEEVLDFLDPSITEWDGDIITNPPFKIAQSFIEKGLSIIPKGNKVAMFLKLQFLEGRKRKEFFQRTPPKVVYVFSGRIETAKNGDFHKYQQGSAIAFAWFVWEKGYTGDTIVKWIN